MDKPIKITCKLLVELGVDIEKVFKTVENMDMSKVEPIHVSGYQSLKSELVSS